ncbi:hypothetical protein CDEN61S_04079 [Castellaniella denitrificans]
MALMELAGTETGTRIAEKLGAESFDRLSRWFAELRAEDDVCARAAVRNLDKLLDVMEPAALGRWVLTGLRLYCDDVQAMRRYFALRDRQAIETMYAEAGRGELAAAIPGLEALYCALSGEPISIQARKTTLLNGPPARPVITPAALLIPDAYTRLDGPDSPSLYRAAVGHALAHRRYSRRARPVGALKPMSVAVMSLIEDARVEALLIRDFPGFRNLFLRMFRHREAAHDLSFEALASRLSHAILDPGHMDDNYWVQKGRDLFREAAQRDLEDYAAFRGIGSVLANDLGQMRVRFSAQQYAVHPPYRDDHSFLWDYGDDAAPPPEDQSQEVEQGIDLAMVSIREAREDDLSGDTALERRIVEATFTYPEWDYRLGFARDGWCVVVERSVAGVAGARSASGAHPARSRARPLSYRLSRARRLRKQLEGEELDLNAVVEVQVDRRSGLSPEPRLFMRPGYEAMSSSILMLMDLSESTNDASHVDGQTVLSLEKAAVLYLAGSAAGRETRLAIHGFSSNTRHEVDYFRFMDFGDAYDDLRRALIRNAAASHSTRMGAAIRHAKSRILREKTDLRAIVVVTDGAPSDIDVHDADYLIEDARAAVQDAAAEGVHAFCLTVDRDAAAYVKTIFGAGNFQIVDDHSLLSARLYGVFVKASLRG